MPHADTSARLLASTLALNAAEVPACPHAPATDALGLCALHPTEGLLCRACWTSHAEASGEGFGRTCDSCYRASAAETVDSHLTRSVEFVVRTERGDSGLLRGRVLLFGFGALCTDCLPFWPQALAEAESGI